MADVSPELVIWQGLLFLIHRRIHRLSISKISTTTGRICLPTLVSYVILKSIQSLKQTVTRKKTSWDCLKILYSTEPGSNRMHVWVHGWSYQTMSTYRWAVLGVSIWRLVLLPVTHTWPFWIVWCKWSSVERLQRMSGEKASTGFRYHFTAVSSSQFLKTSSNQKSSCRCRGVFFSMFSTMDTINCVCIHDVLTSIYFRWRWLFGQFEDTVTKLLFSPFIAMRGNLLCYYKFLT